MENVDFNSNDFTKKVKQNQSKNSKEKKIDATGINMGAASSLLKSNIVQIGIFLLLYFTLSGIAFTFILLFTKPLVLLICITTGVGLYFLLKKQIAKKFKF